MKWAVLRALIAQGMDSKHHELSCPVLNCIMGGLSHWMTQHLDHVWAFISLLNSINNAISLFISFIDSLWWQARVWVTFAYKPLLHVGTHKFHLYEIPLGIPAGGAGSAAVVPALCRQPSRVIWTAA